MILKKQNAILFSDIKSSTLQ